MSASSLNRAPDAGAGTVTGMNVQSVSIGEMGGGGLGHWSGMPMALLVREALSTAHDLEEAIALADHVVVMTAAPGTVKAVFDIDLPRPRGAVQEIRFGKRFGELHHEIWESLRDEVEQAYARTAASGAADVAGAPLVKEEARS